MAMITSLTQQQQQISPPLSFKETSLKEDSWKYFNLRNKLAAEFHMGFKLKTAGIPWQIEKLLYLIHE